MFFKNKKFQKVFGMIREPKKLYFGILAAVVASVIAILIPFIYGRLADIAIKDPNSDIRILIGLIGLWLMLSLSSDELNRYSVRQAYELGIDLNNDLQVDIFHHILDLPLSFHKTQKMGKVLRRIDRSLTDLLGLIDSTVFSFFPLVLSCVLSFIVLFWLQWKLTLILVLAVLLYVGVTFYFSKDVLRRQRGMHRGWEKADGSLWDAVLNVQAVKAAVAEDFERKRNYKNYEHAGEVFKKYRYLWLQMNLFQKLIFSLGFIGVFGWGVIMLRQGLITPGTLIMFFGYINLLTAPLTQLASQYRSIKSTLFSLNRSLKYYDLVPEHDLAGAKEIDNLKGDVEFNHVDFGYKKTQIVLHDINFKVKAGETVAFVGESGVGKSTLVDMVGRYHLATKGKILIDGIDVKRLKLKSLRSQMAIVPQEVMLFNDNIKNNISYGLKRSDKEIIEAAKAANADEFIQTFPGKYHQMVGERGVKLSGGQKQRLAIARAILRNPKILILDEATSALDSVSEKMVQEALRRLIKDRTTFIIAHRLSTIQNADKIIVLEKGKIVEMGNHDELMANPQGIYRNFWEMQAAIQKVK